MLSPLPPFLDCDLDPSKFSFRRVTFHSDETFCSASNREPTRQAQRAQTRIEQGARGNRSRCSRRRTAQPGPRKPTDSHPRMRAAVPRCRPLPNCPQASSSLHALPKAADLSFQLREPVTHSRFQVRNLIRENDSVSLGALDHPLLHLFDLYG